ncbi:DUF3824 domain-containing protein [Dactylosporangium sp. CS-047395]|uniref:DUF3824 domain-containing protein n=1 Tax=Dactylosporangium sp. CS-047395 TaxID=3239936 RepID=UPI003D9253BE
MTVPPVPGGPPTQPFAPPAPQAQYPPMVPAPYQAPVAIPFAAPAPGHPQQQPAPYGFQPPPASYGFPPPPAPQIVINNTVSATAIAGFGGRRRQSFAVHVVLLLCTAGLGNLVYAWYISSWNRRHGF